MKDKKAPLWFGALVLIVIIFTMYTTFKSVTENVGDYRCIEKATICQKETLIPVMIGTIPSTIVGFKDVSCNESYDREIQRCIKQEKISNTPTNNLMDNIRKLIGQ